MAKRSSKDVGFFQAGGRDLLGYLTSLRDKKAASLEETHTLGDEWFETEATGLKNFELSQDGFYDDEADGVNDALNGQQGLPQVISFAPSGNVIGRKFIGFEGPLVAEYARVPGMNVFHKANATYKGSGQVDEGVILQHKATQSGDWDTEGANSVDHGASSSAGGAAYLQVGPDFDLDGYDDLVVTVRDSDDDVTYADLVAFTAVTAGPTAERKTVAGTIERHLAISAAFGGSGTDPVATVTVGFGRF